MVTALTRVLTASQRYMRDQTVKNSALTVFFYVVLKFHFTVTGGNEAEVDLVFIRPFLLYYLNVFLCRLVFLSMLSMRKGGLYQNKVSLSLAFTQRHGYYAYNCKMVFNNYSLSPNGL